MSSFSELAAKLVVEPDSTLLCLGDIVKYRALYNIFDREIFIFDGDNPVGLIKKKDIHDFEIASKTISPKVRYYDCREYVQNGTGVFIGIESLVRAIVEGDDGISWNQFNRLDYLPHIAYMVLDNPFHGPLSRSLLWVFESQVESHVGTLRYIGHENGFARHNLIFFSPYTLEDLKAFIQLWFRGILMASVVFTLEFVVSRTHKRFLRNSVNFVALRIRSSG